MYNLGGKIADMIGEGLVESTKPKFVSGTAYEGGTRDSRKTEKAGSEEGGCDLVLYGQVEKGLLKGEDGLSKDTKLELCS